MMPAGRDLFRFISVACQPSIHGGASRTRGSRNPLSGFFGAESRREASFDVFNVFLAHAHQPIPPDLSRRSLIHPDLSRAQADSADVAGHDGVGRVKALLLRRFLDIKGRRPDVVEQVDLTIGEGEEVASPLQGRVAVARSHLFASQRRILSIRSGQLLTLAGVTGVTDADPFILSIAPYASADMPLTLAWSAIVLAAASNNLFKGNYACGCGDGRTGTQGLALLTASALLELLPLSI